MQTIDGLDDLDQAIESMVRNLNGKQLEHAVNAAGAEILKEVENKAPVRTGKLKASIGTFSRSNDGYARSTIQVANSKSGGIEHYAVFLEYGTSSMRAKPFMRPAFDAAQQKAVEAFMQSISAELK